MSVRKRVADLAATNGLGRVHRTHRSRHPLRNPVTIALAPVGAALALLLSAYGAPLRAALVVLVTTAVITAYTHLADTGEPAGRVWIAVADGGLLIVAERDTPRLARWNEPGPAGRRRYHFALLLDAELPTASSIGAFSGRRRLIAAIEHGAPPPMPSARLRRASIAGAGVLASGLLLGSVLLPRVVTRRADRLPQAVADLAAACARPGVAYRGAAPYTGSGPHPAAVFFHGPGGFAQVPGLAGEPSPWNPASPQDVQLLACVAAARSVPGAVRTCTYATGGVGSLSVRPLRRGQYSIDVYELRTHRRVGTYGAIGAADVCPRTTVGGTQILTELTVGQYREVLNPLVNDGV